MVKKQTKAANRSGRRTKLNAVGKARDLDVAETKKVRGGTLNSPQVPLATGDGSVRPVSPAIQDGTSNTIFVGLKK